MLVEQQHFLAKEKAKKTSHGLLDNDEEDEYDDDDELEDIQSSFVFGAFYHFLKAVGEKPSADDPFMVAMNQFISKQRPFGILLAPEEGTYYNKIVQMYKYLCENNDNRFTESLVRLWLGVGSVEHSLNAVDFLVSVLDKPLKLNEYLSEWSNEQNTMKARLLRQNPTSHLTDIATNAQVANLLIYFHNLARDVHKTDEKRENHLRPSMCCDTSGAFLYILSRKWGLLKIGTGHNDPSAEMKVPTDSSFTTVPGAMNNTVAGRVYAQKLEYAVHAGGYLVCTDTELLLRTPMLPSNQLMKIDKKTLMMSTTRVVLKAPGQQLPSVSHLHNALPTWMLEYETADGTWDHLNTLDPSMSSRTRGKQKNTPLSPVEKIRKLLLSPNWTFGQRVLIYSGESSRGNVFSKKARKKYELALNQDGFVLNPKSKKPARVRIRCDLKVLPILYDHSKKALLSMQSSTTSAAEVFRASLSGDVRTSLPSNSIRTVNICLYTLPAPHRRPRRSRSLSTSNTDDLAMDNPDFSVARLEQSSISRSQSDLTDKRSLLEEEGKKSGFSREDSVKSLLLEEKEEKSSHSTEIAGSIVYVGSAATTTTDNTAAATAVSESSPFPSRETVLAEIERLGYPTSAALEALNVLPAGKTRTADVVQWMQKRKVSPVMDESNVDEQKKNRRASRSLRSSPTRKHGSRDRRNSPRRRPRSISMDTDYSAGSEYHVCRLISSITVDPFLRKDSSEEGDSSSSAPPGAQDSRSNANGTERKTQSGNNSGDSDENQNNSSKDACHGCGTQNQQGTKYVCMEECHNFQLCHYCYLMGNWSHPSHHIDHRMDVRRSSGDSKKKKTDRRRRRQQQKGKETNSDDAAKDERDANLIKAETEFLQSKTVANNLEREIMHGAVYLSDGVLVVVPPNKSGYQPKFWRDFQVGDVIDCQDMYGKWYEADVLKVAPATATRPSRLYVHYHGWNPRWDEWIPVDSPRFAKRNTHTPVTDQNAANAEVQSEAGQIVSHVDTTIRLFPLPKIEGNSFDIDSEQTYQYQHKYANHNADIVIRTKADTFCFDERSSNVWSFSSDGCLERWDANMSNRLPFNPQLLKETDSNEGDIFGIDAARALIRGLRCCTHSPKLIMSHMRQLFRILQHCEQQLSDRTGPAKKHLEALMVDTLELMETYIQRAFTARDTEMRTSNSGLLPSLRRFLEKVIVERKYELYTVGSSSSFEELTLSDSNDVTVDTLTLHCCRVLVEGFELFYSSWKERMEVVSELSSSVPGFSYNGQGTIPEDSSIRGWARASIPARHAMAILVGQRYVHGFMGVKRGILFSCSDRSIYSSSTVRTIQRLIARMSRYDKDTVVDMIAFRRSGGDMSMPIASNLLSHTFVYFVLSYMSQLYTHIMESEKVPKPSSSSGGSTSDSKNTPEDENRSAFLQTARSIFQHCVELLCDMIPSTSFNVLSPFIGTTPDVLTPVSPLSPIDDAPSSNGSSRHGSTTKRKGSLSGEFRVLSGRPVPLDVPGSLAAQQSNHGVSVGPFDSGLDRMSSSDSFGNMEDSACVLEYCGLFRLLPYAISWLVPILGNTKVGRISSSDLGGLLRFSTDILCLIAEKDEEGATSSSGNISQSMFTQLNVPDMPVFGLGSSSVPSTPLERTVRNKKKGPTTFPVGLRLRSMIRLLRNSGELVKFPKAKEAAEVAAASEKEKKDKKGNKQTTSSDPGARFVPLAKETFTGMFFAFASEHSVGTFNVPSEVGAVRIPRLNRFKSTQMDRQSLLNLAKRPVPPSGKDVADGSVSTVIALSLDQFRAYREACIYIPDVAMAANSDFAAVARNSISKKQVQLVYNMYADKRTGFLTLDGFLQLHLKSCAAGTAEILNQLRSFEYTYDFLEEERRLHAEALNDINISVPTIEESFDISTSTPIACLLEDVKVCQASLLHHLFSTPNIPVPLPDAVDVEESKATEEKSEKNAEADLSKKLTQLSSAVVKLTDSQIGWTHRPNHVAQKDFLVAFIRCEDDYHTPTPSPANRGSGSSSRVNTNTNRSAGSSSGTSASKKNIFSWDFDGNAPPLTSPTSLSPGFTRTRSISDMKDTGPVDVNRSALHEPATSLSLLFRRCMGEMGGGEASRELNRVPGALASEKAFAAACIKHNGLIDECIKFSRSVDIVKLIDSAAKKGIRCMFNPKLPQWFKQIIRTTFSSIRRPLLSITGDALLIDVNAPISPIDDAEEDGERKVPDFEEEEKMPPLSIDIEEPSSPKSDDGIISSPMILPSSVSNSSLPTTSDSHSANTSPSGPSGTSGTGSQPSGSASKGDDDEDDASLHTELSRIVSMVFKRDERRITTKPLSPRPRKLLYQRETAKRKALLMERKRLERKREVMQALTKGELFAQKIFENSFFLVDDIDELQDKDEQEKERQRRIVQKEVEVEHLKSRPTSTVAGSFRNSPRASPTNGRRQHVTDLPPPTTGHLSPSPSSQRRRSMPDEDDLLLNRTASLDIRVRPAAGSNEKSSIRTPISHEAPISGSPQNSNRHLNPNPTMIGSIFSPKFSPVHDHPDATPWMNRAEPETHSLPPFDASWITLLVRSTADGALANSLKRSMRRLQSVAQLRIKYLSWLNLSFQHDYMQGSNVVVEQILPVVLRSLRKGSRLHVLHHAEPNKRSALTERTLLGFYKNLVFSLSSEIENIGTYALSTVHASRDRSKSVDDMDIGKSSTSSRRFVHTRQATVGSSRSLFSSKPTVGSPTHSGSVAASREEEESSELFEKFGETWFRIKSLLHFFNVEFEPRDCNMLIGSGIFACLFRFLHNIDDYLVSIPTEDVGSSDNTTSSVGVSHFVKNVLYHLKELSWQTVKYLTVFGLAKNQLDKSVLALSVGNQYLMNLHKNLIRISRLPSVVPLDHAAHIDGLLFQTMDILRILLHFTQDNTICKPRQIVRLLRQSDAAPPSIRVLIFKVLCHELPRYKPSDFMIAPKTMARSTTAQELNRFSLNVMQSTSGRNIAPPILHEEEDNLDEEEAIDVCHMLVDSIGKLIVNAGLHALDASSSRQSASFDAKSYQNSCASASGYQSWRESVAIHAEAALPVVSEIIGCVRILFRQPAWKLSFVPTIRSGLLHSGHVLSMLSTNPSNVLPPSKIHTIREVAASLAILGGHAEQIRPGSCVQITTETGDLVRGFVHRVDWRASTATVVLDEPRSLTTSTLLDFDIQSLTPVHTVTPPSISSLIISPVMNMTNILCERLDEALESTVPIWEVLGRCLQERPGENGALAAVSLPSSTASCRKSMKTLVFLQLQKMILSVLECQHEKFVKQSKQLSVYEGVQSKDHIPRPISSSALVSDVDDRVFDFHNREDDGNPSSASGSTETRSKSTPSSFEMLHNLSVAELDQFRRVNNFNRIQMLSILPQLINLVNDIKDETANANIAGTPSPSSASKKKMGRDVDDDADDDDEKERELKEDESEDARLSEKDEKEHSPRMNFLAVSEINLERTSVILSQRLMEVTQPDIILRTNLRETTVPPLFVGRKRSKQTSDNPVNDPSGAAGNNTSRSRLGNNSGMSSFSRPGSRTGSRPGSRPGSGARTRMSNRPPAITARDGPPSPLAQSLLARHSGNADAVRRQLRLNENGEVIRGLDISISIPPQSSDAASTGSNPSHSRNNSTGSSLGRVPRPPSPLSRTSITRSEREVLVPNFNESNDDDDSNNPSPNFQDSEVRVVSAGMNDDGNDHHHDNISSAPVDLSNETEQQRANRLRLEDLSSRMDNLSSLLRREEEEVNALEEQLDRQLNRHDLIQQMRHAFADEIEDVDHVGDSMRSPNTQVIEIHNPYEDEEEEEEDDEGHEDHIHLHDNDDREDSFNLDSEMHEDEDGNPIILGSGNDILSSRQHGGSRRVPIHTLPPVVQHLHTLMEMGFPINVARMGLAARNGVLQEAVELIFSGQIDYDFPEDEAYSEWSQLLARLGVPELDYEALLGLHDEEEEEDHDDILREHESMDHPRPASHQRRHRQHGDEEEDDEEEHEESGMGEIQNMSEFEARKPKFYRTSNTHERSRLITRIHQYVCDYQSEDLSKLKIFDFIDGKDAYGDWYLGQIVKVDASGRCLVHFFAWDDQYNEWISSTSDRIRPASLFEATLQRLDGDRFIRRVKIYGDVLAFLKTENVPIDKDTLVSRMHLCDPYTFEDKEYKSKIEKLEPSEIEVGSAAVVTAAAVELLSKSLGHRVLDLAGEFAVGDKLMVRDTVNKLCQAEVTDVRPGTTTEVRIHYVGWPSKWDEWVPVNSDRIQGPTSQKGLASRAHGTLLLGTQPTGSASRNLTPATFGGHGQTTQLIDLVGRIGIISRIVRPSEVASASLLSPLGQSKIDRLRETIENSRRILEAGMTSTSTSSTTNVASGTAAHASQRQHAASSTSASASSSHSNTIGIQATGSGSTANASSSSSASRAPYTSVLDASARMLALEEEGLLADFRALIRADAEFLRMRMDRSEAAAAAAGLTTRSGTTSSGVQYSDASGQVDLAHERQSSHTIPPRSIATGTSTTGTGTTTATISTSTSTHRDSQQQAQAASRKKVEASPEALELNASDIVVEIQVWDEDLGTTVAFWTKLELLQRPSLLQSPGVCYESVMFLKRKEVAEVAIETERAIIESRAGSMLSKLITDLSSIDSVSMTESLTTPDKIPAGVVPHPHNGMIREAWSAKSEADSESENSYVGSSVLGTTSHRGSMMSLPEMEAAREEDFETAQSERSLHNSSRMSSSSFALTPSALFMYHLPDMIRSLPTALSDQMIRRLATLPSFHGASYICTGLGGVGRAPSLNTAATSGNATAASAAVSHHPTVLIGQASMTIGHPGLNDSVSVLTGAPAKNEFALSDDNNGSQPAPPPPRPSTATSDGKSVEPQNNEDENDVERVAHRQLRDKDRLMRTLTNMILHNVPLPSSCAESLSKEDQAFARSATDPVLKDIHKQTTGATPKLNLNGRLQMLQSALSDVTSSLLETVNPENVEVLGNIGLTSLQTDEAKTVHVNMKGVRNLIVTFVDTSRPHCGVRFYDGRGFATKEFEREEEEQSFIPAHIRRSSMSDEAMNSHYKDEEDDDDIDDDDDEEFKEIEKKFEERSKKSPIRLPEPSPIDVEQAIMDDPDTRHHPLLIRAIPSVMTNTPSPFIVSNPVYVKTGGLKSEDDADEDIAIADEGDFSFVLSPYTSDAFESAVFLAELILYVRRSVVQSYEQTPIEEEEESSQSVREERKNVLVVLGSMLRTCVDAFGKFLSRYQSVCQWPSPMKARAYEVLSYLFTDLIETSLLPVVVLREEKDDANKEEEEEEEEPLVPSMADYLASLDLSWVLPFVPYARRRFDAEKGNWPLYSSYSQRLLEFLVSALRAEFFVTKNFNASSASGMGERPGMNDEPTCRLSRSRPRSASSKRPQSAQSAGARLLPVASHSPRRRTNNANNLRISVLQGNLENARLEEPISPFTPISPMSLQPTVTQSQLMSNDTSRRHSASMTPRGSSVRSEHFRPPRLTLASVLMKSLPMVLNVESLMNSRQLQALWKTDECACELCQSMLAKLAKLDKIVPMVDFQSPFWNYTMKATPRNIPAEQRFRIFDHLVAITATPDRFLPEVIFNASNDPHGESAFIQMCKTLRTTDEIHLRGKLGDVAWKARFRGEAFRGAEGLPGPFRQSMTDICADLRRVLKAPRDISAGTTYTSLLIPCPNMVNMTGLDRDKLMLNPASIAVPTVGPESGQGGSDSADASNLDQDGNPASRNLSHAGEILQQFYCFGQLLGITIRSKGVLDIDLIDAFWKQLLNQPLTERDLSFYDYTAWSTLQFRDPRDGHSFSKDEFEIYYDDLRFTTTLSDGRTVVELRPGGANITVKFEERWQYAKEVYQARFQENSLQMSYIRRGLYSIIPEKALSMLSWKEVQKYICGEPTLNVEQLKKRTVYAPRKFTEESPVVQNFWKAIESFSVEDRSRFLQFAWARSRLPPETEADATWRMKVNILEAADQGDLPTAETCFFNVNIPKYNDLESMMKKLHLAVTLCSSITS